jgi:hypothetical protein
VTRSNLWGKNRSIDLFTRAPACVRVTLARAIERERRRSVHHDEQQHGINDIAGGAPIASRRCVNTRADVLVTAILDQAKRSELQLQDARSPRAKPDCTLTPRVSVAGRHSFQHTKLFDINFAPDDPVVPLIDRLFPQVRLSKFCELADSITATTCSTLHAGDFLAPNSDGPRAVGSEVGFVKTFAQAFSALRAGQAAHHSGERGNADWTHGFPRVVETVDCRRHRDVADGPGSAGKRAFLRGR